MECGDDDDDRAGVGRRRWRRRRRRRRRCYYHAGRSRHAIDRRLSLDRTTSLPGPSRRLPRPQTTEEVLEWRRGTNEAAPLPPLSLSGVLSKRR